MVELHPHDIAHGGEAVARKDGKAHFIAGTMPGEVVEASIVEDRGSWARAALINIIEPSPMRRTPPCRYAEVCGGCQWQFTDGDTQRTWKRRTVHGQLQHLGRIEDPVVHDTVKVGPDLGYRNRMDFHVVDGRPGLFRPRSHDIVHLEQCPLLVPELQAVYGRLGDLGGADRLTLRAGTRTGDLVAIVEGDMPESAESWGIPVAHRTRDNRVRPTIGEPRLTEIVSDVTFRIPLEGFFQNNTRGAEALVGLVADVLEVQEDDTLLDGYCGLGLFGATVGQLAGRVVGIESTKSVIAAARENLNSVGVEHKLVAGSFTRDIESIDEYWDVAVVDPPRRGLGRKGIEAVASAMPRRIAYVACDPASLARDTRMFADLGYHFIDATPVDLFPQTYHVETVARFDRSSAVG
ncbi:MAG: 23S rRNA (uracil(1939)-C(5))-methyltransferase RlmD [Acidimicrobiia bacterium]|nr:MAG: 23S rRNA (uracil(1939)-C(5))-methyltransferase RlmD [Acidimicrobiia bacterium]